MIDNKKVIFLDYFEDLSVSISFIDRICKTNDPKNIAIISSNYDTYLLAARYNESSIVYIGDILSRQDYAQMDKYVFNLTDGWYKGISNIEGVTEYKGIQFGNIIEDIAQRYFSFRIRNLEIVLKAIEMFKPSEFVFIGEKDTFLALSEFTSGRLNIKSSFVYAQVNEASGIIKKALACFYYMAVEFITGLADTVIRFIVLTKKASKAGILIDNRLYCESKDL